MKKELNILIPTDFSEVSENAVALAITLAEKFNTKIFLLNSYRIPLAVTEVPYDTVSKEIEEAKMEAMENMQALMKEITEKNADINCVSLISPGFITEAIETEIKEKKIDLVVMGSKGSNALKTLFLGNTCARMIEEATCPVIIVPEKAKKKQIHKILYATNLLDSDINALQELVVFANPFDAEIIAVHIALPEEKNTKKWLDIFKQDVKKAISYKKIRYILKSEPDFVEAMEKLCLKEKADLVVTLTIKRAPFEKLYNSSLTKKLSYHTEIPLMVFHSKQ
jgi:nucleotide-binding universal stress UspA family protein